MPLYRKRRRMELTAAALLATSLFFSNLFTALSILDPVDFLALQSIRKSLDDMPGSNFFEAWDFTADPCGFPGVFCASDRVQALALGDPRAGSPGLMGRLDPAIGRLSALSELSLVPGRVTGSIPDTIASLTNLRFLALSKNFLSGSVPDSIGSLSNLHTLDLSFNQLTGTIPQSIANLPSLANLVLCHNQLSGSIPQFPESSPLLRLDLKHNQITSQVPNLPSTLQYLSLSSNQLTGQVDSILVKLNRLNFLDLAMNQLEGPIPPSLFTYPLKSLQLQRNLFDGTLGPENEVQIPLVDLSFNRLWGPISPLLASVSQLYLNNNRFTGEVPARLVQELMGSGRMQVLYLQHNFLTGIEISPASSVSLPTGASLCLQFNCMVPPVGTPCPLKAGTQKTRPADQCPDWRG
ncbi:Leucine-rich repeat (LRR) family protein [Rhynchospora pubera]|uniref:Leucine-rich repeat (LRR) family protein n=1 Tax=Rhynchospora pubera TaxID=906938 RepID=A0AAV8GHJ1_9POAL|nr:Leucine-rich repeat (LRR) family protein [Rhynchospora pubera]